MQLIPADPVAFLAFVVVLAGTAFLFLSKWPKAYTLGILILVVYGLQVYDSMFRQHPFSFTDHVIDELGFIAGPFLAGNQWWSPLTYQYVHGGFLHVFGNLFILLTAGPVLEDRIGGRAFLLTYFIGGFAAAASHLLLAGIGPEPRLVGLFIPAVGASGAIFAVLAAVATLSPRERLPMTIPGFFFILWLPAIAVLFLFVGFNLVYMLSDLTRGGALNIAWYGHFAGLAVGLLAAVAIERTNPQAARAFGGPSLPDVEKLRPLARTADMNAALDKMATMRGTTPDDATFREAWLDRFFAKAVCPRCGGPLARKGMQAGCGKCGWSLDFKAPRKPKAPAEPGA